MTLRKRGKRWPVEIYDPAVKSRKRYVGTFDTQAEAREAKRRAEQDVARRRGKRRDETVAGWAARWLELRPRQKESTNIAYREQVAPFEGAHGAMPLREVSVELALEWLGEHRWTLGGIRAMFSDPAESASWTQTRSPVYGYEDHAGARTSNCPLGTRSTISPGTPARFGRAKWRSRFAHSF